MNPSDTPDVTPRTRSIREVFESRPTLEGAGVHLKRAFGHAEVPRLDPFLLLDDFRSENPAEFVAGFPWHPHRGIETVTYMLDGCVDHGDSLGHHGVVGSGDVQWMTAGRGIIHQEMPKLGSNRKMGGFQLWVNLPAGRKMAPPRYQEVRDGTIPRVEPARGLVMKVVSGNVYGVQGPVRDIAVDPQYLDVRAAPHTDFLHRVPPDHTVFAYVYEGAGSLDEEGRDRIGGENLVIFGPGDRIRIRTGDSPLHFLLVSGKPLREPVAWWGPIVMNHRHELEEAVEAYQNGTFLDPAPAAHGSAPDPRNP